MLAEFDLELWELNPSTSYPITSEMLSNPATYGALLDELTDQIQRSAILAVEIEQQGGDVIVEVRWNGISSYTANTQVEVFLRDSQDPHHELLVQDSNGKWQKLNAIDPALLLRDFSAEKLLTWVAPGRFEYQDDPKDLLSRGMHLMDSEERPLAIWDDSTGSFRPSVEVGPYRTKLVNGFDIDYYGFTDTELQILWEAMQWIRLALEDPDQTLAGVVSVRNTELPDWIAGVGGRGDVRLAPESFTIFRDMLDAPREVDVLWIAALLIHEAAHVNQPGECTPAYAESQGMTFLELGLFRETGPGQAYQQEMEFLIEAMDLRTPAGGYLVSDPETREKVQWQIDYNRATLGRDRYPNGEMVPTCANAW
jgi:hypothetical protein